jgi:MFS family permease
MFRSLSVRNYRLFASGQLVSLIGTWMQMTTQDWLVVALGGGGMALGVTLGLQFGPMLVFGLYGGVIADRIDKRRLLLATQSMYVLLALTMCTLVATGAVALPVIFVFAAAVGTVTAFDAPARLAFVPEMVGPERLPNAIGLNSITFNGARVVGPAVAGVLVGAIGTMPGAALVFGFNAASYIATITSLLLIRTDELFPGGPTRAGTAGTSDGPGIPGQPRMSGGPVAGHADGTSGADGTGGAGGTVGVRAAPNTPDVSDTSDVSDAPAAAPAPAATAAPGRLRDGLRYVVRHRSIAGPILLLGVVGTLGMNFPVTMTLMASEVFHGTAATYGMLTAVLAVGGIAGSVVTARRRGPPRPATLVLAAAAFGFFETLAAVAPTLPAFVAVTVPMGACILMFTTTANATVQLATEPAMRGRVMALYVLVFLGTTPIGAPVVGAVSEAAGPRAGLALGGVSCLLAAAAMAAAHRAGLSRIGRSGPGRPWPGRSRPGRSRPGRSRPGRSRPGRSRSERSRSGRPAPTTHPDPEPAPGTDDGAPGDRGASGSGTGTGTGTGPREAMTDAGSPA